MPLAQLVYTSRRSNALDRTALEAVVHHSSDNNRARGVSGILLCHGRNILQLLEGDRDTITPLFDKIRLDPRHTDVRLLVCKDVRKRLFPEWGMGLAELGNKSAVCSDRLARLIEDVRSQNDTAELGVEARVILHDFQQQVLTAV